MVAEHEGGHEYEGERNGKRVRFTWEVSIGSIIGLLGVLFSVGAVWFEMSTEFAIAQERQSELKKQVEKHIDPNEGGHRQARERLLKLETMAVGLSERLKRIERKLDTLLDERRRSIEDWR